MRVDRTELRNKIYIIIQQKGRVTGKGIREALGMPPGAETSNVIGTAMQPLLLNGLVTFHGRKEGYSTNEIAPGVSTSPTPETAATKPMFVHMIEIPRATLKVLVQAHIEADTAMEGAFGKAMLCALKKLI